jgi:hypothetical protein
MPGTHLREGRARLEQFLTELENTGGKRPVHKRIRKAQEKQVIEDQGFHERVLVRYGLELANHGKDVRQGSFEESVVQNTRTYVQEVLDNIGPKTAAVEARPILEKVRKILTDIRVSENRQIPHGKLQCEFFENLVGNVFVCSTKVIQLTGYHEEAIESSRRSELNTFALGFVSEANIDTLEFLYELGRVPEGDVYEWKSYTDISETATTRGALVLHNGFNKLRRLLVLGSSISPTVEFDEWKGELEENLQLLDEMAEAELVNRQTDLSAVEKS